MSSITYHPDGEVLAAYAMGTLPAGMELLVSGHLTYCSGCRKSVSDYELIGGAALGASPSEVEPPSFDATLAMLDAIEDEADQTPHIPSVLPMVLHPFTSPDVEKIEWKFRLPGLYEHEIDGFAGESVSLLKARPGAKILSHTHEGEEATLILSGQMQDGNKVYKKGDVALADDTDDHQPHIIGNEMCICLVVMSGKLRFTGTLGRALNVLMP